MAQPNPLQIPANSLSQQGSASNAADATGTATTAPDTSNDAQLSPSHTPPSLRARLGQGLTGAGRTAGDAGKALLKTARSAGRGALRVGQAALTATAAAPAQALSIAKQHPALGHPKIQRLLTTVQVEEWVALIDKVDVAAAEQKVRLMRGNFPHDTPRQIAHRLMKQNTFSAGGTGLAASIVPGGALSLLAVDWTTMALSQAELVLQIAIAYGLEAHAVERRGEALAIIGLTVGGNRAVKVGLSDFRGAPAVGVAIGAASNALMNYAVGYGACRYYEAKLHELCTNRAVTQTLRANDDYLVIVAEQQEIIDHILSHMVLAGNRHRMWQEVRPELEALGLSDDSLNAIADHMSRPQPLPALLQRLQPDFATTVLAHCYRIAQLDGAMKPEELVILEVLADRFKIGLDDFAKSV